MRKWILLILTMFVLLPTVSAAIQIQISGDNTTWEAIDITKYGGVINETNKTAFAQNLNESTTYYIRARNTTTSWNYTSVSTNTSGEVTMASLAITIFTLLVTCSMYGLAAKKEIVKNKYVNLIMRRSFLVLGIYFTIFTAAIMATISDNAGLGLTQEMFFFMKLFGWFGYPAMIFLMLSAIIQSFREMKIDKHNKRVGESDGE